MFSIDSKFYRFTVQLSKIVWTNLLFTVLSVFILPIPAAFSSLVHLLNNENDSKISHFFTHMKESWQQTIPLGLFNLFSILFCLGILPILGKSLFAKFLFFIFGLFLLTYNIDLYVLQDVGDYGKHYFLLLQESFIFTVVVFLKECLVYLVFMVLYTFSYEKFPILVLLLGISAPIFFYLKIANHELSKTETMKKNRK